MADPTNQPEVFYHVSQSQLSIARHYGKCLFNGVTYLYCPVTDTLTRADILKARKQWRIIVNDGQGPDRFHGEPYRTRKAAIKAMKARPPGTSACLFGPEGVEIGTYQKPGR